MKRIAWVFVCLLVLLCACGKRQDAAGKPRHAAPEKKQEVAAAESEATAEEAPAAEETVAEVAPEPVAVAAEAPAAALEDKPRAPEIAEMLADFEKGTGIFNLKGAAAVKKVNELDSQAVHMADKTANISFWAQQGRDWSAYNCIRFDVYNPTDDRVIVPVVIMDTHYQKGYFWRINRRLPALKGRTTITIDMAKTPRGDGGPKDLQDAPPFAWDSVLQLVIAGAGDIGSFYVDNIRVEKADLTPPPMPETLQVADFESGTGSMDLRKGATVKMCAGLESRAAHLPTKSWFVYEKPGTDWSAYDFLKIDLFNPTDENVKFHACFKDNSTPHGYYSWINRYSMARPGRTRFELNLRQLRRGEGTVKDSIDKRPFNWDNFWQFIIIVQNGEVFADNVRLEKVEGKEFEGLLAFDFGPADSAPLAGFKLVSPDSSYFKEAGFGWMRQGGMWRRERMHPPDILFGDWISASNNTFAIDLPNGTYKLWIGMSDPGEWEFIQNYTSRSLAAENRVLVKETMDGKAFLDRVFRFVNVEDKPSEDIRAKYCQEFMLKPYDVRVADGQLNLGVYGSGPYAATVNGIVVYPAAKAAEGQAFMDWVEKVRRDYYYDRWIPSRMDKQTPDPGSAAAHRDRGYILFQRRQDAKIQYYDAPQKGEELQGALRMQAARGEAESVTFSLYALKDLQGIAVEIAPLTSRDGSSLPADAIWANHVSWKFRRVGGAGTSNEYGVQPFLLEKPKPVDAVKGTPRRFYVSVRVPRTAAAGDYTSTVRVKVPGAPPASIPIELTVLPIDLAEADMGLGAFGVGGTIPATPYSFKEITPFIEQGHHKSLKAGRDHGFTYRGITSRHAYKGIKNGKAQFDLSAVKKEYELCKSLGYTHINIFGPRHGVFRKAAEGDLDAAKKSGFDLVDAFVKALFGGYRDACAAAGLPDPIWCMGDEPPESKAARYVDMYTRIKRAAGASSSISFSPHGPNHLKLLDTMQFPCVNIATVEHMRRVAKAGHQLYVNNQGSNRWAYGVWMHRLRAEGVQAYRQFMWVNNHNDPFYPLDGYEDDTCMVSPDREHDLRATEHILYIREGIDDYRYLQMVRSLAQAKRSHPQAAAAMAFYSGILKKADFTNTREGRRPKMNWDELNRMRAKAADFIIALSAL